MRRRVSRAASVVLAVVLAAGLAACTGQNDDLAAGYRAGDDPGFISRDFTVKEIAPDERGAPIRFSGETDRGDTASSDDLAGDVVVVNFWYAGCGPCRVEAPELEKANQTFAGEDVSFLGINIYDSAATSLSFADTYGVTYPSALAVTDAELKLAFAEVTSIQAVPTTLVLDRDGRVAARIIGALDGASILETLVRDTLAERS